MTTSKTPTAIILLAIFTAWAMLKTVSSIFLSSESSTDMAIFGHYGFAWLGYVFGLLLIAAGIAALYSIFTRQHWGVRALYTFFVLNVVVTVFVMILSMLDIEFVKNAYTESRSARGLNIENVDKIINPVVMAISSFAYVAFYAVLAFFTNKNRAYFLEK